MDWSHKSATRPRPSVGTKLPGSPLAAAPPAAPSAELSQWGEVCSVPTPRPGECFLLCQRECSLLGLGGTGLGAWLLSDRPGRPGTLLSGCVASWTKSLTSSELSCLLALAALRDPRNKEKRLCNPRPPAAGASWGAREVIAVSTLFLAEHKEQTLRQTGPPASWLVHFP